MKTFRVSVAGGIDAVTDLALGDGKHVLFMENLNLRSGKAVPFNVPLVNPNVTVPSNTSQVFAYRNRLLFNSPGRRSYTAEYFGDRERIYWTQYGGNPMKMIEGVTVPLGIPRPASPTISIGSAIAPQNISIELGTSDGSLPKNQTISFRLAYNTSRGVLPAGSPILVTTTDVDQSITLNWSNPKTDIPVSEIWVFVGNGTDNEAFLSAIGAFSTTFSYPTTLAATGALAKDYDQSANYQYCHTFLRDVNGVEDESGPSDPTPSYQATLARKVVFDPWSEGLLASSNTVTWGSAQPGFQLINIANIPGSQSTPLTVSSIAQDPLTGNVIATFTTPHSFHDSELIYIVGCSPDPFLNPNITQVANGTARDAISPDARIIGMLVQTLSDGHIYQLQGGIQNSNWVDVTGTPAADLPVQIQIADASVVGSGMFTEVILNVSSTFVPPGTGLSGVTAYRIASVGIDRMDFNPQSGVLDVYTSSPHSLGTEKATFSGFSDTSWNDTLDVVGDPNNNYRIFVSNMSLPANSTAGFTGCTVTKAITELAYGLGSGSLTYSATSLTEAGTNTPITYATVTSSTITGATGPQGMGINQQVVYTNGLSTGICPVLGDVLYLDLFTTLGEVKKPVSTIGVLARGLLLNDTVLDSGNFSGPVYTSGIQFIPYNDYIIKRRIYRAGGTTQFENVVDLDLDVIEYLDGIPDSGLGSVLPTQFTQDDVGIIFEPAPFGLTGLTTHYNMAFAWDPSSNQLRWTVEGNYDAWPEELQTGFATRILGLFSFNHALCVFCEDGVYRMDGASSTTLVRNKTKSAGCRAGGSIQFLQNRLLYLSDQGLMEFDGQESNPLTDLRIPGDFWLANSRYLNSTDPQSYLVPPLQDAAYERLVGPDLPQVTPRDLMPYMVSRDTESGGIRSFIKYGRYYLYWGGDHPEFAAQTMICIDFSAPGQPITVVGIKVIDAFVDELERVHMVIGSPLSTSGIGR